MKKAYHSKIMWLPFFFAITDSLLSIALSLTNNPLLYYARHVWLSKNAVTIFARKKFFPRIYTFAPIPEIKPFFFASWIRKWTQWTTLSKLIRSAGRFWDIFNGKWRSNFSDFTNNKTYEHSYPQLWYKNLRFYRYIRKISRQDGTEGDMARLILKDWYTLVGPRSCTVMTKSR